MNPRHTEPAAAPKPAEPVPASDPASVPESGPARSNARRRRGVAVGRTLLAAALVATAGVAVQTTSAGAGERTDAASAASAATAGDPDFYRPPAELPASNGELVRTEELRLGLSLPGIDGPLPGSATRLMYRSIDSRGEPVAVTGAYIEPAAKWKGGGERPLVALAPGTMGQGDQCAASKALEKPLSLESGSVSVGYENLAIYRFLARGVAVVVTDYVGLGTTDRPHTYVNRLDAGHAVLDAVRAARSLPDTSLTPASRIGLYGYSEGGGATGSAAELQPGYAPEIELAGSYVGAPPADLTEVLAAVDGSTLASALGWSINGFLDSDPELGPILDKYTNDKGKDALRKLSEACVGDGILGYAGARSEDWTKNGESIPEIVAAEPEVAAILDRQRIGRLAPTGPVRVATGTRDNLVTHEQARTLAADWCAKDARVTYVPVQLPDAGEKLVNHFLPLIADQGAAVNWVTNRLSGEPDSPNCSTVRR